jgi:SMI1-KNR4 cell-wall
MKKLTLDTAYASNYKRVPINKEKAQALIADAVPGAMVSEDFIDFYEKENGGSFLECVDLDTPIGPLVINYFLSMNKDGDYSMPQSTKNLRDYVGAQFLVFGEDPAGNVFMLDALTQNGNVFFWEHEQRTITDLGKTFRQFVDCLSSDE